MSTNGFGHKETGAKETGAKETKQGAKSWLPVFL